LVTLNQTSLPPIALTALLLLSLLVPVLATVV
jgi:hypothetical protein